MKNWVKLGWVISKQSKREAYDATRKPSKRNLALEIASGLNNQSR